MSTHNDPSREQIEMGKLFAEMMNLIEDTRKKSEEQEALRAQTRKMEAEILKLNTETRWHPFYKAAILWGSAFAALAAVIALVKAFL